ncbi:hypothetical protein B0H14DRAFT_3512277 [Mycena olivaceomarginata]|nr:hypothetical protein B0H14DRAFT_3512277 [Mycena olivaceomarginata]
MASDLCRMASKFCLNISHSSSFAPRQLPPGFSTSHTLDFGLRTDRAAAECLVFFVQFPETLCLRYVNSSAIDSLSTLLLSYPLLNLILASIDGRFLSTKRSGAPPAEA